MITMKLYRMIREMSSGMIEERLKMDIASPDETGGYVAHANTINGCI
jgi:hypothetical protein